MLVWLLTRGFVLWLFLGPHSWVTGDVAYFADSLSRVAEVGLVGTLVEYPLPGVVLVGLPWLAVEWLDRPDLYAEAVLVLGLATDAAFTGLLHRFGRPARSAGVVVWLLAVPLLGATTYARFDLVPGVLAAAAVLLLVRHPRVAAASAAVATGLKLWPALVLMAIAARRRERWTVLGVAAAVGTALVAATVVLAGWGRLVSPLTWQADRGLQIEAVLATPAMAAWAVDPTGHTVSYSAFNAFEISGPGVPVLLATTTALGALLVAGLVLLWALAWRRGDSLTPDAIVWLCLASVSGFLVSSKVLSPQYLLWLLPLAAAGLAVADSSRGVRRLRRWSGVLLVTALATQLVFPVLYAGLTTHGAGSTWVVLLLAARNALLVWLLVDACREAWWHLRRPTSVQRGSALDRQPPGPEGDQARTLR